MAHTTDYASDIIKELQQSISLIAAAESDLLVEAIQKAGKIFVAGAGRSGLMSKAFTMRLMQMGLNAYVVGETVTPGLDQEDLLIISSGSGETKGLVSMAEKTRQIGGVLAAVTLAPESTIGKLADVIVKLPGSSKSQSEGGFTTSQPMASLFEQTLLVFYDAIILKLMEHKGLDSNTMYSRHANLE
ncbi:6-phospho-3-hexuloisomerase [Paenibacillus eucommiae]|uniref:6-phospho-3-hexuloisomerase n=1 Tax=Paenibacillus eucommiae TaxID=1355755 RepID=A0ABS4J8Y7_9BACL|nr:6-phospho-3-hexuloisomerase [Paenibacillus eucommiae]MBP1996306.1 6-phospho-3-hexuloisomerase [Paenibacillus eucommiae]